MNSNYLKPTDDKYPVKLLEHLTDPEPIFYFGRYELFDSNSIAIVGSRKCTAYGRGIAWNLAKRAAEYGVTVISGLALGIDGQAHRGALDEGGDTVAVIANGINRCYPKSHFDLQKKIKEKGLLVTECEDDMEPKPYTFPRRNRIITALADAVVIVEAAGRSGALISAECAAEQGKMLYAVPGNINSESSFGTNKLIKDGVTPLISLEDVFRDMGLIPPESKAVEEKLGEDERRLLDAIRAYGNISIDELSRLTGYSTMTVNGMVTVLEMKGIATVEMGRVMLI